MRADETQRQIVRLVLERERTLDGLERPLGSGAVAAVKTLAAGRRRCAARRVLVGLPVSVSGWMCWGS
jgi:hypothetical protein